MDTVRVRFEPSERTVEVERGEELLSAAIAAGVYINSSCGGDGVCGRCKVQIREGQYRTEPTGRVSADERARGVVLACLTTVRSDLVVYVPPESRLDLEAMPEEEARQLRLKGLYARAEEVDLAPSIKPDELYQHSPLATKMYLQLPRPSLDDRVSDLDRLYREIRRSHDIPIMQTGLKNIRRLGALLRSSDWKVTVTLGKRNGTAEVVLVEPGDTSARNYGVAFDIGTTTVSGQLVNLNTKEILGTMASYNRQAAFGSDVISRIIYASSGDGLERLHHAVIDSMNAMIQKMAERAGVALGDITSVMCAGNTTMTHLLLRVDPTYIRRDPYVPAASFVPVIRAAEAGVKINPRALLACVPGVSTYVGGDITAGVVAANIADEEPLTMLIDVGTNGEIVLGNKDWLVCCSASAGPAFEGSGVTCGMRAVSGAVQRVSIGGPGCTDVRIETIGDAPPRGICGSGYIDLIAELFSCGIMDRSGRLRPEAGGQRVREIETGREYVLVPEDEAETDQDIVITEEDIENLKRSKGAIYAAASILLRKLDLSFRDVERVYIAGGFGTTLDVEKAVSIGLLPDLPRERFRFLGNSSLAGAREILLSYPAMKEAEDVARKMTAFELSAEPAYMDEYVSALFFPHTDLDRFKSVVPARG
jgi:uncharacterized 2Fe-2S/4Fe-4S cluster protein (DUF4445 family)